MPCLTAKVVSIGVNRNVIVILIYVPFVRVITFIMFLLKQSKLSAIIFLFVLLVLSLLCINYTLVFCRNVRVSWQRGLEPSFCDRPVNKFGRARLSNGFVGKKHRPYAKMAAFILFFCSYLN